MRWGSGLTAAAAEERHRGSPQPVKGASALRPRSAWRRREPSRPPATEAKSEGIGEAPKSFPRARSALLFWRCRPKFRVRAATLNSQVGSLARHAASGTVLGWLRAALSPAAWRYGLEFLAKRTGPVSMAASQVCALVPSFRREPPWSAVVRHLQRLARNQQSPPDLQFHFQPLSTTGAPCLACLLRATCCLSSCRHASSLLGCIHTPLLPSPMMVAQPT